MIRHSYDDKTLAVTVDFKNNIASTATETDTLSSIENAVGGSASDTFIMNEDNKTNKVDGGSGTEKDTISYANYVTNGVNVNLSTANEQIVVDNGGVNDDKDTILNIENIIGSSKDDTVIGNSEANSFMSGDGNDTFIAGVDTDNNGVLEVGDDGADYFDGGTGTGDTINYSVIDSAVADASGIDVTLDSSNERDVLVDGQSTDKILNVENVVGTQDNDYIKGDVQNNTFSGQAGDDQLFGEAGNDKLLGEAGDDTLIGGSGDDILIGGDRMMILLLVVLVVTIFMVEMKT